MDKKKPLILFFFQELGLLVGKRESIIGYFFLLIELSTFFSIFFLLYGVYEQDVERSRILSKDSEGLLSYKDKRAIRIMEKKRVLPFLPFVPMLSIPSLVIMFIENRIFLFKVLVKFFTGEETESPPSNDNPSSPFSFLP